jgi:hypothetical protein
VSTPCPRRLIATPLTWASEIRLYGVLAGILDVVEGVVIAVIQERQADLEAHRFATTTPTPALGAFLRKALTPRLVASIAGVTETRATRQWAQGNARSARANASGGLRAAAHVAWLITEAFNTRTAQAWMQGTDPMLNDRSPAWVLRHATDETDRAAVLASARRLVVQ